jgi:hypothetical protein
MLKSLLKGIAAAATALVLLAAPAQAATYYVSETGDAGNDGSDCNNGKTMAWFNANAVAGDVAIICDGTYTTMPNPTNAGTGWLLSQRITYVGNLSDTTSGGVVLNGTLTMSDNYVTVKGVRVRDGINFSADGCSLAYISSSTLSYGAGADNNMLANAHLYVATTAGSQINWTVDSGYDSIYNSRIQAGAYTASSGGTKWWDSPNNGTYRRYHVFNRVRFLIDNFAPTSDSYAIILYSYNHAKFTDCYFRFASNHSRSTPANSIYGVALRDSSVYQTWKRDTIHVTYVGGTGGTHAFDFHNGTLAATAQGLVMDSCWIQNDASGGQHAVNMYAGGVDSITIKNSVIVNTGDGRAINFAANVDYLTLTNNTIVAYGGNPIGMENGYATNMAFSYNILYQGTSGTCNGGRVPMRGNSSATGTSNYNLFYEVGDDNGREYTQGYGVCRDDTWRWPATANTHEANTKWASPMFQDSSESTFDPRPRSNSAALGTYWSGSPVGFAGARGDTVEAGPNDPPEVTAVSTEDPTPVAQGVASDIQWTATDDVGVSYVYIWISYDGGSTYSRLTNNEANDGAYEYTWPTADTDVRVKVSVFDAEGLGDSLETSNFTVSDQTLPTVSLTTPDGGESWNEGQGRSIVVTLTDNVEVTAVSLWYSDDDGANWTNISHGEDAQAWYLWSVPLVATTQTDFRIKVWATDAANNQAGDSSTTAFTVNDTSNVLPILIAPNGGENWEAGSIQNIHWRPDNLTGSWADYEWSFSGNSGSSWTTIENTRLSGRDPLPDSLYGWTVPSYTSTTMKIRIRTIGPSGAAVQSDSSDADFNIVDTTPPSVVPLLSDPIRLCDENSIYLGGADNVAVTSYNVYYQVGAGDWTTLAAGVSGGTTALNWQPGNTVSYGNGENIRVRVAAYDAQGESASVTTAYSEAFDNIGPTTTFIYPNGGEILMVGDVTALQWSAQDCIWEEANDIALYYALGPGYDSWQVITSITDNDGSYSWTVPAALANSFIKFKVRAIDQALNITEDISAAPTEVRQLSVAPPKRVRDLMVLYENALDANNRASLRLAWSAPLKDETTNENISAYSVRVFTVQPTGENFTTAGVEVAAATGLNATPGTGFTNDVTDLEPNTKYWFAVRTQSASSGWSEISIPVTTWTPIPNTGTVNPNKHPFPHIFIMYPGCNDWQNKNCPSLITSAGALKTTAADTIARFQLAMLMPNAFLGPHYTTGGAANAGNNADSAALYGALHARIRSRNSTATIFGYDHTGATYGPYVPGDDSTTIPAHNWRRIQAAVGGPGDCMCATLQSGGSGSAGAVKGRPTCYHSAWRNDNGGGAYPDSCMSGSQWYNINRAHRDTVTGDYTVEEAKWTLIGEVFNGLRRTTNPASPKMFDGISQDLAGMVDDSVSALLGVDDFVNQNQLTGYVDTDPGATDNRRWQFYRHYRNAFNLGTRMSRNSLDMPRIFNPLPAGTADYHLWNGWVYEGWPTAQGSGSVTTDANWNSSVYAIRSTQRALHPKGYFRPGLSGLEYHGDRSYNQYHLLIGLGTGPPSGTTATDTTTAANRKSNRFGLGTASLFNGLYWQWYAGGSWGGPNVSADWGKVTWEENWVNTNGTADGTSHGWLGAAMGRYWSTIAGTSLTNLLTTAVTDTGFETGTLGAIPNGWARTQTSGTVGTSTDTVAPVGGGSRSLKVVTTTTSGGNAYDVSFRLRAPASWTTVNNGNGLTLRFWAKTTDLPKYFYVLLRDSSTGAPPGTGAQAGVWADTIWRQHTITLYNNVGTNQSDLYPAFYLGDTVGTWYIDNITAYATEAAIYGRHFENGMVVVNPTDAAQTYVWADDGYDYKRINGNWRDANWVNDGSLETDRSITVASYDAAFLIRRPDGGWDVTGGGSRRSKWWRWWGTGSTTPTPAK